MSHPSGKSPHSTRTPGTTPPARHCVSAVTGTRCVSARTSRPPSAERPKPSSGRSCAARARTSRASPASNRRSRAVSACTAAQVRSATRGVKVRTGYCRLARGRLASSARIRSSQRLVRPLVQVLWMITRPPAGLTRGHHLRPPPGSAHACCWGWRRPACAPGQGGVEDTDRSKNSRSRSA